MRLRVIVPLLVLVLACFQSTEAQESPDIKETIAKFYESIETGDVEARLSLLANDVLLMPNHWTIISGKEAATESFTRYPDAIFKLKDRDMLRMEVSGDIAYTVNSYYYTYHLKDQPEQWHKTKNVHVWQRDSSGEWKLSVDIWNSDVPIEQFSEE